MKIKKILLILVLSLLASYGSLSQANTGKTDAQKKIRRLLKELGGSKEGPQRVKILLELSDMYQRSDPGQALNYTKQGLALSEKINDPKSISDSLYEMGHYYYYRGNYTSALEYYAKSLKIDEQLGDRRGIAYCYIDTGRVYKNQGNNPLALEYYFKSLKISEELGDRKGIALCYISIGHLYIEQGNYPLALEYF